MKAAVLALLAGAVFLAAVVIGVGRGTLPLGASLISLGTGAPNSEPKSGPVQTVAHHVNSSQVGGVFPGLATGTGIAGLISQLPTRAIEPPTENTHHHPSQQPPPSSPTPQSPSPSP